MALKNFRNNFEKFDVEMFITVRYGGMYNETGVPIFCKLRSVSFYLPLLNITTSI